MFVAAWVPVIVGGKLILLGRDCGRGCGRGVAPGHWVTSELQKLKIYCLGCIRYPSYSWYIRVCCILGFESPYVLWESGRHVVVCRRREKKSSLYVMYPYSRLLLCARNRICICASCRGLPSSLSYI
jgi:hypothetical protein